VCGGAVHEFRNLRHDGGNLGKVPRQRKQKSYDKRASIYRRIPATNTSVQDLIAKAETLLEALPASLWKLSRVANATGNRLAQARPAFLSAT